MRTLTMTAALALMVLVLPCSALLAEDDEFDENIDPGVEGAASEGASTDQDAQAVTWGEWAKEKEKQLTDTVKEVGEFLTGLLGPAQAEAATGGDAFEGDKREIIACGTKKSGNALVCALGEDGKVDANDCQVRRLERRDDGQVYGCSRWGCLPVREPATQEFVYDAAGNPYVKGATPFGSSVGVRPAELPRR